MIAAGADVNATALKGYSALDTTQSEPVALALIKAGAKLPTDHDRLQRLLSTATAGGWKALLPILEKALATATAP